MKLITLEVVEFREDVAIAGSRYRQTYSCKEYQIAWDVEGGRVMLARPGDDDCAVYPEEITRRMVPKKGSRELAALRAALLECCTPKTDAKKAA